MGNLFIWKIFAGLTIVLFFGGRLSWSFVKGKRKKDKVASEIVKIRFLISLFVYFIIPFMLIFDIFDLQQFTAISTSPFAYILGSVGSLAGLILMFLARFHRQGDWGFMGDDSGDRLFMSGIYGITRHPYYVGAIFVGIGVYLTLNSWLVFLMIPVVLFVQKVIEKEEHFLESKYRDEWFQYTRSVGVIPWIKYGIY